MKDQEILDVYIKLAPFLGAVLGPGCEIVIHDVNHPETSIIAIENSLSGRQIGDPMTDLARDVAAKGRYRDQSFQSNYLARSKAGAFSGYTYYIKNEDRLIGLLCVNKSTEIVQGLQSALHSVLEAFHLTMPGQTEAQENLDNPMIDLMRSRITESVSKTGIPPSRMSMQEKVAVVRELNEKGVLMMKGAVPEIADQLGVSVPTVYRYLSKSDGKIG